MASKTNAVVVDECGHDYASQLPAKPPPSILRVVPNQRGRKVKRLASSDSTDGELPSLPTSDELICMICRWRFARSRTKSLLSDKVGGHIAAHFVAFSPGNLVKPSDYSASPQRQCPFCRANIIFSHLNQFIIHLDDEHCGELLRHDTRRGDYDMRIYMMFFDIKQGKLLETIGHFCVLCRVYVDNFEEGVHNHLSFHSSAMETLVRKTQIDRGKWHNFQCALCSLKPPGLREAINHALHSHKKNGLLHQLIADSSLYASDIIEFMRDVLLLIFRSDCERLLNILLAENKDLSARIVAERKTRSASLQSVIFKSTELSKLASSVKVSKRSLVQSDVTLIPQTSASSSISTAATRQPSISAPTVPNKRRKVVVKVVHPAIHTSLLMASNADSSMNSGLIQPKREDSTRPLSPLLLPTTVQLGSMEDQEPKKVIKTEVSEMDRQCVDDMMLKKGKNDALYD